MPRVMEPKCLRRRVPDHRVKRVFACDVAGQG